MPEEELMDTLQNIINRCRPAVTQNGPVEIFELHPHSGSEAQCEIRFRGKVYYLSLTSMPS